MYMNHHLGGCKLQLTNSIILVYIIYLHFWHSDVEIDMSFINDQ